jgi:hypothetical protein
MKDVVVTERRRRPRGASGSPSTSCGTGAEWVIRREARGGRDGYGIFLSTGEHVGFEPGRESLLDLLAGAGVPGAICQAVLCVLDETGEAHTGVVVARDALPRARVEP